MLVKCEVYTMDEELIGDGLASSDDNITVEVAFFNYMADMTVKIIQKVIVQFFDRDRLKIESRVMTLREDGFIVRRIRVVYDDAAAEDARLAEEKEAQKKLGNIRDDVRLDLNMPAKVFVGTTSVEVVIRDLSCGGMRFSTKYELYEYDTCMTSLTLKDPGIVTKMDIIRKQQVGSGFIYGCKFVNLQEAEANVIRSWIFAQQAERRKKALR